MFIYIWRQQAHLLSLNMHQAIDSELVVWMKDEKVFKNIEVEIDTEILNLQAVSAYLLYVIAYLLHKGPTS